MPPLLRNILAPILGFLVGSAVNLGLVKLGQNVFPVEGLDVNDMDAYAAVIPTLSTEYFIFPFLAHALGTLVGAAVAAWVAASHKLKFALAIGFIFLVGGVVVNYMLTGPLWFTILDIVVAYIPMAYLGGKLVQRNS